ncbi:hypothetical protein KZ774_18510 [Escherichia coli]|nr:hypothetical protein [Escherichia coli]MBW6100500.1 hypothetical protein [Escherichia coli]
MKAAAMPPFLFSENSVSALKKWHITARFSLNFFTLGYVKTYRRLYTEDKPDE